MNDFAKKYYFDYLDAEKDLTKEKREKLKEWYSKTFTPDGLNILTFKGEKTQ